MTMAILALLMLCTVVHGAPTGGAIIDAGFPYDNQTQWWPGMMKYEVITRGRIENSNGIPWLAFNAFQTTEHVGTHVDAPYHFNKNNWKLGEIPQERFFAPGVLIDVSNLVNDNFNFVLEPEHIKNWEKKNGKIPSKSIVLVRFGWAKKFYFEREEYFGFNKTEDHELNFPGFSTEAAELFIKRGVFAVGLDTPSMDPGKNEVFGAHQLLLNNNVYGIENVNLSSDKIPAKGFNVHVLPMKITEGTGAPTRVIIFLNSEDDD